MSDTYAPSMRSTFLYFAYGSNLLTKRIHLQNPSAIRKGIAELKVNESNAIDYVQHSKINAITGFLTSSIIFLNLVFHRDIVWDFIYQLASHQYGTEHRLQSLKMKNIPFGEHSMKLI